MNKTAILTQVVELEDVIDDGAYKRIKLNKIYGSNMFTIGSSLEINDVNYVITLIDREDNFLIVAEY